MSSNVTTNNLPFDKEIVDIVDYVLNFKIDSELAYKTSWYCFLDTIGCGL